jgi:hypothetical protein
MVFVGKALGTQVQLFHRRLGDWISFAALVTEAPLERFSSVAHSRKFTSQESPESGRKGFLHLVLTVCGTRLHFVNVHLNADLDNRVSVSASPSPYAEVRERLLGIVLRECGFVDSREKRSQDRGEEVYILGGDFNFRLDGAKLLVDVGKAPDDVIEAKLARCDYVTRNIHDTHLLKWDLEPRKFPLLREEPVKFPPSYCLKGDEGVYDNKRLPCWPDRVLYSVELLQRIVGAPLYQARPWGGDHALVAFSFSMKEVQSAPESASLKGLGKLAATGNPIRSTTPSLLSQIIPATFVGAAVVAVSYLVYTSVFRSPNK